MNKSTVTKTRNNSPEARER